MNKLKTISLSIITSLLLGNLLYAQDTQTLDSITVTANKMEENIQEVPQSITVIDDEVLKEKGIKDIPDVINEIPNMDLRFGFSASNNVNFRGLNYSIFTNNNPVVIYIDGVGYSNAYGFDASLNNVERIEVLRGPQGTLYGKDAIGAVIKVVTKEPDNEWSGNIGTEYGSNNAMMGSFNVSGPLVQDKLYLGMNARYQQDDGWITNDYTNDDEYNKDKRHNMGATLLYTPTDRFTAKVIVSNDYSKDCGFTVDAMMPGTNISESNRDGAEHVNQDQDSLRENESMAQSVHLKYEFDRMTFSSTTIHRDAEYNSLSDVDMLADTVWDGYLGFNTTNTETWAEELRLSSSNTEGVRWVAGAYFEKEDVEKGPYGSVRPVVAGDYESNWVSETESETMAVFGQTMIPFGDSFELTLGGRYQRISKEMDLDYYVGVGDANSKPSYSIQPDETWNAFLGKAALSYRLNDSWNSYASVAQGYMPGGFNYSAYEGSGEDNTFESAQSTNFEIGVKGEFNRGRLAASVFYTDIEDIHVTIYDEVADGYRPDNAGGAHSLGAELELTYFLIDSIELTTAIGIIDSEYDDYDTGTVVYDGESISNTPLHTARIGVAYLHPNGFYARGDVMNMGKVPYYNSYASEFAKLDSYTVADAKIGYRFKGFDVYAYCKNLTDEKYITSFMASRLVSAAFYGEPRTFGIGVRYSF